MLHRSLFAALLVGLALTTVAVQRSHAQLAIFDHKLEVHGFGGYVWSSSQEVFYNQASGDLDFASSGWWGVAVDVNLPTGVQLELLYTRQDTQLEFKRFAGPTETLNDQAIEFWHVGAVYTRFSRGNVHPFTSFTLGGTRLINEDASIDDIWKFSVILGAGAKIHVNERLGIRAQARMPWTFTNYGAGLGIGTGGVSVGVGGSGVVAFDLSGGLFLMF